MNNTNKKIIIGLGNPEPSFDYTRHNAGFMTINYLAEKFSSNPFSSNKKIKSHLTHTSDEQVLLIKPDTFMNESGTAVRAVLDFYKWDIREMGEQTFVIHDDLDLELGTFKVQFAKGPYQHNGLTSLYQHLGTKNFWHVRIGVDGRSGERTQPPADYVTNKFPPDELVLFERTKLEVVDYLKLKLDLKPLY